MRWDWNGAPAVNYMHVAIASMYYTDYVSRLKPERPHMFGTIQCIASQEQNYPPRYMYVSEIINIAK